ncbi:squalene synthase HpnC [Bradyrhizobium sp. USDA 328]
MGRLSGPDPQGAAIERQDWFCGRIPLYGGRGGIAGTGPRERKSLSVQTIVNQPSMTSASELRSGKGDRDENFPVASWIIHPRHRALILAYYNFVRTADDIADHATLPPDQKLSYLDLLEAELLGKGDTQAEAVTLRRALAERGMAPRHALDVLIAFRMDVTKLRYENWDEVIHYCRYSAMPVGRFMLDVHGESTSTWAASDALCAALQINNHLQDCGKDFRELNRVYLPRDALAASGASVEQLGLAQSPPAMLACLQALAARNEALLKQSKSLSAEVRDFRLGVDISVIQAYADRIVRLLKVRDPLRERVHLNKFELLALSLAGMIGEVGRRAIGRKAISRPGTAHDA